MNDTYYDDFGPEINEHSLSLLLLYWKWKYLVVKSSKLTCTRVLHQCGWIHRRLVLPSHSLQGRSLSVSHSQRHFHVPTIEADPLWVHNIEDSPKSSPRPNIVGDWNLELRIRSTTNTKQIIMLYYICVYIYIEKRQRDNKILPQT